MSWVYRRPAQAQHRQRRRFIKKVTVVGQFLRPDGDTVVGGWTPTPSSPTTLFDKIDEVTPSDTDFITEA